MQLKGKNIMVSILIPFRNEELFIRECLDSILAQTYEHWEAILVNDRSTDQGPSIAEEYATRDARFRIFYNPGSGVIEALRHGLKQSTGALITRMDADDLKTATNLESLVERVEPGTVAVGKVEYFRDGGVGEGFKSYATWLNALSETDSHFSDVYRECVIPSPCWMMTRTDLDSIGGFEHNRYPEDYDLCFRMYAHGLKTKGTDLIIHRWRDYDERSSRILDYYADHTFLDLKMHFFAQIDFDPSKKLVVYGAGKKAKYFVRNWKTPITWVTSNEKKIGHIVYGNRIQSAREFLPDTSHQIVVLVASPKDKDDIKQDLGASKAQVFWFC